MLLLSLSRKRLVLSLVAVVLSSAPALAHKNHDHSTATGAVRERLEFMENMGKAMGGLMAVVRGKKAYDADEVMGHLRTIRRQSGENLTKLFPEGSNSSPSEALPAVWQDWDGFVKVADGLGTKAQAMIDVVAAEGEAGLQQNIRSLGSGCRDCHSEFRKKQQR